MLICLFNKKTLKTLNFLIDNYLLNPIALSAVLKVMHFAILAFEGIMLNVMKIENTTFLLQLMKQSKTVDVLSRKLATKKKAVSTKVMNSVMKKTISSCPASLTCDCYATDKVCSICLSR